MANYLPPTPQASNFAPPIPPNVSLGDSREPKLQLPLRYGGELGRCRGFLAQCLIFFKSQPSRYSSEEAKVSFILSLLTGTAQAWAEPLIRANSPIISSSERVMKEMAQVFDHDVSGSEAANKLIQLRQGKQSVAEFSIIFRALAGEAGWHEGPLISLFRNALSDPVQDALVTLEPPATLDVLISTAIRTDNRIRERERHKTGKKLFYNSGGSESARNISFKETPELPCGEEPMDIGNFNLGGAKDRVPSGKFCRYCKKQGHMITECRKLRAKNQAKE